MTVLIDSWAWIEYWKGGQLAKAAARYIEGQEEAVVSSVNIAETYYWILKYYGQRTADSKIASVEKRSFTIAVDKAIALEAAKIKKADQLALADSLVLATARAVRATLVTGDSDFEDVEGVVLLT